MARSLPASRALVASSEEYEVRIAVHGPGYEYALFLTLTQPHAVAAYAGVVAQRKTLDIIIDASQACRAFKPGTVNVAVVHGNIAGY